jgi:hypothetical protein
MIKTLNFGGKEKFEIKVIISEAHKDKVYKIIILINDIIYFCSNNASIKIREKQLIKFISYFLLFIIVLLGVY